MLEEQGYSQEDMDKIFAPRKYDMRSWYLGFAVLLMLAGTWTYFKYENWLLWILSGLLFLSYSNEARRLKKQ